jgi:general secretion pathway protein I
VTDIKVLLSNTEQDVGSLDLANPNSSGGNP